MVDIIQTTTMLTAVAICFLFGYFIAVVKRIGLILFGIEQHMLHTRYYMRKISVQLPQIERVEIISRSKIGSSLNKMIMDPSKP